MRMARIEEDFCKKSFCERGSYENNHCSRVSFRTGQAASRLCARIWACLYLAVHRRSGRSLAVHRRSGRSLVAWHACGYTMGQKDEQEENNFVHPAPENTSVHPLRSTLSKPLREIVQNTRGG